MYQAILNVRFESVVSELTEDNKINASKAKFKKLDSKLVSFTGETAAEVEQKVKAFIEEIKWVA